MIFREIIRLVGEFREQFAQMKQNIPAAFIINMDEIPIFFSYLVEKTQNLEGGSKYIPILSTSGYKKSLTVTLALAMSGELLRTMLIYKDPQDLSEDENGEDEETEREKRIEKKRERESKREKKKLNMTSTSNASGWMTPSTFQMWIEECLLPYLWGKGFPKGNNIMCSPPQALLLLDEHKIHRSRRVQEKLKQLETEYNISHLMVPLGTAGLVQPLDTEVGRPFRFNCKGEFEKWFRERLEPSTPTREEYAQIIGGAVSHLAHSTYHRTLNMKNTFQACERETLLRREEIDTEVGEEENIKNYMRKETPLHSQEIIPLFGGESPMFEVGKQVAGVDSLAEQLECSEDSVRDRKIVSP